MNICSLMMDNFFRYEASVPTQAVERIFLICTTACLLLNTDLMIWSHFLFLDFTGPRFVLLSP